MAAVLRVSIVLVVLGGSALFTYWKVSSSQLERTIREMEALQQEMQERLAAKEAMLERLNRSRRLAHIHVLDQQSAPGGEILETNLLFIELDDDGGELARQEFRLPGDVLFVDAWSVKFHQNDVADGHPLRGRTLLLLRRIYSDQMPPINGYPIDVPGAIPPGYATGEIASFEQSLWQHFWKIATDPELAEQMGVRVAQGEAVYKPVRAGQVYELIVDAAGGMSLMPLPQDPVAVTDTEE